MLVSVVMSVYNSEDHLEKSIESILNQTYKNFEFIIIDDGSKDNSINIVEKYAATDPRVILIKNEKNLGLATSLNKGIEIAKGEYIARQDADDMSTPDRLELQLNYAIEHPEVDIVASNSYVIDINDNIVCTTTRFSRIKNFYSNLLNKKSIFFHGTAFLKKSKLMEVGLYDPRFYFSQDGEYWLRLISNGAKVHTINKPLYYYRVAPTLTNKKIKVKPLYNKVKNMIYVDKVDQQVVDSELQKINQFLVSNTWKPYPYYMADYWKNLATRAYLNEGERAVIYKYLAKAFKEKNPASRYVKYVGMGLLYLFPHKITNKAFKLIKN